MQMLIGRFGIWTLCFFAQVLVRWAIVFWSPCGWPSWWLQSRSHLHTKLCPLAQGHLQCAKELGIMAKKIHGNLHLLSRLLCALHMFISWEVESKLWLPVLNSSLLCCSSLPSCSGTEDVVELWANGSVPLIIYPGQCFITEAPKCSTKRKASH